MDNIDKLVCKNLHRLRVEPNSKLYYKRPLSQAEMAKVVGVSQSKICRLENEEYIPSIYEVARYAVYFGVTIDEIVFGKYERRDGILDFYEVGR